MFIKKPFYLKTLPHGDGDGDDDDGDKNTVSKAEFDDLQAKLSTALESVTKLEDKNKQILGEKKDVSDRLKAFGDLDAENVKTILAKFENDEELKLIAEGKHDEVISKRVEKAEAEFRSKIEAATTENSTLQEQLAAANSSIKDLLINQNVTAAFVSEKGIEGAIPDVVLRAHAEFAVEDGKPVARDAEGKIRTGKDGALTITEWVANLKEDAPHLFPASEGAGGGGNQGGGGQTDLDAKMAAAASSGDMKEYRRLKEQKKKAAQKAQEA